MTYIFSQSFELGREKFVVIPLGRGVGKLCKKEEIWEK
jgi:hypothetical protein